MENIKVTLETAKLAKEKGFDWVDCQCLFLDDNSEVPFCLAKRSKSEWVRMPNQSYLQKWLRDVHNIHVEIYLGHDEDSVWYNLDIYKIEKGYIFEPFNMDDIDDNTYEETLEKGLQEALKTIKK